MSILKQAVVENKGADALTDAPLYDGRDYKLLAVKRYLNKKDVGEAQKDTGVVVGRVNGGTIEDVINFSVTVEDDGKSYPYSSEKDKPYPGYKIDKATLYVLDGKSKALDEKAVIRALLLIKH